MSNKHLPWKRDNVLNPRFGDPVPHAMNDVAPTLPRPESNFGALCAAARHRGFFVELEGDGSGNFGYSIRRRGHGPVFMSGLTYEAAFKWIEARPFKTKA